jgi:putative ABC transport system substrate-binding protein
VLRRDVIALIGGAAVAWPLAARAQQPAIPVIGFLHSQSPGDRHPGVAAFHQGVNETGYVEGQNVAVEYRWAEGHYDRTRTLADDLVRRQVAVIAVFGGGIFVRDAAAATRTIPMVFLTGGDPVEQGLVANLNRPGGNLTGVSMLTGGLLQKRVELLRELLPQAATVALLVNPANRLGPYQRDAEAAARAQRWQLPVLKASDEKAIERAFASLGRQRIEALVIDSDPFFFTRRDQLVALAARYVMPAIYEWREFAAAGGLMSYGTRIADAYRQVGIYAGMILKGAKPGELPVIQSAKVELFVNLKTAKALGISMPTSLLVRADEVIE